jgi:hypothetical protein
MLNVFADLPPHTKVNQPLTRSGSRSSNATFVSTPKSATNRSSAAAYVSRVFAMLIVPRYTWTASARRTPLAGAGSIRTRPIRTSTRALPHIVSRVACARRVRRFRTNPRLPHIVSCYVR